MKITREKLIEKLIDDDLDTVLSGDANELFSNWRREGFCGYNNQSNDELIQEYIERLDPDLTKEIEIIEK